MVDWGSFFADGLWIEDCLFFFDCRLVVFFPPSISTPKPNGKGKWGFLDGICTSFFVFFALCFTPARGFLRRLSNCSHLSHWVGLSASLDYGTTHQHTQNSVLGWVMGIHARTTMEGYGTEKGRSDLVCVLFRMVWFAGGTFLVDRLLPFSFSFDYSCWDIIVNR